MRAAVLLLGLLALAFAHKHQESDVLTTNYGAPIDNARNSETVGSRGPILLEDYYLIERLQTHNRERIPERNVHARGATAKGVFRVTKDVSDLTFAKFLSKVGKETPIACRWSTVIHGRDSPEYLRDPRGFAVKFYTEEGNYDIVGLNFPVFFIRDGIRFPEMIRSLKPNPVTGVQEWWRIYDYFSNYPESTHMFTWLMDDVGIPASYRTLDGWGVHTFEWINRANNVTLVRYYFKSEQGVKSIDDDAEAAQQHFSFHTTDLYEAIARGEFPKWTVYVQAIPQGYDISKLDFDPLDTTKQWPESLFPMIEVGEMVFNENVRSQFLENEQIAFAPSRMVPGIAPSDEKMLQTRLFAYVDTQTYRLGVNNQMLPINRPKCPFHDGHLDGTMNFQESGPSASEINYFPSTIAQNVREAAPYPKGHQPLNGEKERHMIEKTNDFAQAGARYRSFDEARKERFAQRVAASLSSPRITEKILNIWLGFWQQADAELAARIQKHLTVLAQPEHSLPPNQKEVHAQRRAFLRASGSAL
eukprot:Colp12_sorted_trinity150504_noHs@28683